MRSLTPKKIVTPLAALFAGAALGTCAGPFAREAFLCLATSAALGLGVALIPIVAFSLLLRTLNRPLASRPEIRLVPRIPQRASDAGGRSSALGRHPAAT